MDKNESNEKSIKNRKRLTKILHISIISIAVIVLAIEGVLFYQRSYLTPFWVNGQSMYPTLNLHAKDAAGNEYGVLGNGLDAGSIVDYGVMDCHKSAINKIKRFDIIVTKYSKSDTNNKIKRVLGLPGERIYFVSTGKNNEHNGDLYINDRLIEQPIDIEFVKSGDYSTVTKNLEVHLGSDEYFVCGDNRNHSSDSRAEGAVKKEWITGKVVALCGTAEVYKDGSYYDIKNINYTWPRYL